MMRWEKGRRCAGGWGILMDETASKMEAWKGAGSLMRRKGVSLTYDGAGESWYLPVGSK